MKPGSKFLYLSLVIVAYVHIFNLQSLVRSQQLNACNNSTLNNCSEFATCQNFSSHYNCTCLDGFEGDGENCTDMNECSNNTQNNCSVFATCKNVNGGYNCSCNSGYDGDGSYCIDIDECANSTLHNCSENADCHNVNGSYNCLCKKGYMGDGIDCTDIDECANSTLHNCSEFADCHNINGSYNCLCKTGYKGNGINCTDIDECANSTLHNCSENADCHNVNGSYNCLCKTGYMGDGINCTDIDECANNTLHNCSEFADCHNFNGSYNCSCKTGYMGDGINCTDIHECANNTLHNCSEFADCHNFNGSYNCSCKTGFLGDGINCTDIDECTNSTLHNCSENADCHNVNGSYNCLCKKGYMGDGIDCTDIDECANSTLHNCSKFADCHNFISSYNCSCKTGYKGNGINCTDIDECSNNTLHNCSVFATCKNVNGGYNCSCNSGYDGDGSYCIDIDECANNTLNTCSESADCQNFNGSYNCSCKTGFEGDGRKCEDINECLTVNPPCSTLAVCTNTPGRFQCNCSKGYEGNGTACEDLNECTSNQHQCSKFASCKNAIGGYKCDCMNNYVGDGFVCSERPLVKYTTEVKLEGNNSLYGPYFIEPAIKAFGRVDQNIYVSRNGYITLGRNSKIYQLPGNDRFPSGFITFVPFWTAFDRTASAKIYIDQYTFCKDKQVLNRIGSMVSPTFNAKRAIVITWENQTPYPASEFKNENITFQSILATNESTFYMIYNYDKDMVNLNKDANREIMVGYSNGTVSSTLARNKEFFDMLHNGTEIYGLRKIVEIGSDAENNLECLEWHCENKKTSKKEFTHIPCPCTEQQVEMDPTFELKSDRCYESRYPVMDMKQRCCYSDSQALLKDFPGAGFPYNTSIDFSVGQNYCCNRKYKLCNLFYDVYPSDTCSKYEIPNIVHLLSPLVFKMDMKETRFYGAGEFTLLTVDPAILNTTLTVQARVELEANAKYSKIPAYTAFAIKTGDSVLEINGTEIGFNNGTKHTIKDKTILFKYIHLEVISSGNSLGVIMSIPQYLMRSSTGLLTGKKSDGQKINPASEIEVYNLWKQYQVAVNDSLLSYNAMNHSSFILETQFQETLKNLSDIVKAANISHTTCEQSDMYCQYAVALNISNLAKMSVSFKPADLKILENFPPFFKNAPKELYVEIGNNSIALEAEDRENNNFTIKLAANTTYTYGNGFLNLTISMLPFSLKVLATDDHNATSLYWPELFICDCPANSVCEKKKNAKRMFSINSEARSYKLPCTCNPGYKGRKCNEKVDLCKIKPCYPGVACNSSLGEDKMCGACPDKYSGNGRICYDKNFCSKGVCSDKCEDKIGDEYVCSCNAGYKLGADNKTCGDINECGNASTCTKFGQYCFNTPGSFLCKCRTGYVENNNKCELLADKNKVVGSMAVALVNAQQKKMAKQLSDKQSEAYKTMSKNMKKSIQGKIGAGNIVAINDMTVESKKRKKRSTGQESLNVDYTVYGKTINADDLKKMMTGKCKGGCCDFGGFCVDPNSLKAADIDPCKEKICDPMTTICQKETSGFRCDCKYGFQRTSQSNKFQCQDMNECEIKKPCGNVTCKNIFGSYKCSCEFGFKFENASKSCKDVCVGNLCKNGKCVKEQESYKCSCNEDWVGVHCEEKSGDEFRTALIVIGVLFGIVCLIIIGIIVYTIWKMRKSNEQNLTNTKGNIEVNRMDMPSKKNGNVYANYNTSGMDNPAYEDEYSRL